MTTMTARELKDYISAQLAHFFPDGGKGLNCNHADEAMGIAFERADYCFRRVRFYEPFCSGGGDFYHLHADMYASFLYFLANSLYKIGGDTSVCDKLLQLNRTLHALLISYKCEMPKVFYLGHPIGTVLGNADYSDYLSVVQNVTVMSESNRPAPILGAGVGLTNGCTVVAGSTVGDNVIIGEHVSVRFDVPPNSFVYRDADTGKTVIRENKPNALADVFFEKYLREDGML